MATEHKSLPLALVGLALLVVLSVAGLNLSRLTIAMTDVLPDAPAATTWEESELKIAFSASVLSGAEMAYAPEPVVDLPVEEAVRRAINGNTHAHERAQDTERLTALTSVFTAIKNPAERQRLEVWFSPSYMRFIIVHWPDASVDYCNFTVVGAPVGAKEVEVLKFWNWNMIQPYQTITFYPNCHRQSVMNAVARYDCCQLAPYNSCQFRLPMGG